MGEVFGNGSFERVRGEIARDLHPVRPLRPPSKAALLILPVALLLLSSLLLLYHVRGDASAIGFWPLWGPAALMVGAAYGMLVLALRQRAPESTLWWQWWALLPLAAIAVQIGSALATFAASGPDPSVPWAAEAMCSWRITILALPPLLLVLWLLSRGLPPRPRIAGLLAGLSGGFVAEGVYRLFCPLSGPAHIVPWHTGAVLTMGLLGLLVGLWWERRNVELFLRRRSERP